MRTISVQAAVELIPDGASVMIGGFMGVGTPERLVDELVRQRKRGLTVIANDNAQPGTGIGKLVTAGVMRKTIASHIGLLLDRPTIGCAKSRLIGEHGVLRPGRGSHVPLMHEGQEVGRVLRTRRGCKPVYVSVGHKVSLAAATDIIMSCVQTYRIPRPTREADLYVAGLKASLAARK